MTNVEKVKEIYNEGQVSKGESMTTMQLVGWWEKEGYDTSELEPTLDILVNNDELIFDGSVRDTLRYIRNF